MNQSATRTFAVRLAAVVGVSVAGWQFGVRPLRADLAEKRVSLASVRAEVDSGITRVTLQTRTPDVLISELTAEAEQLRSEWGVAADASVLYEHFDAIAHRYSITIERIEPIRSIDRRITTKKDEEDVPEVTELGFAIELVGAYDALTSFILASQTETGLMRVESIRIAPAPTPTQQTRARASLRTTHFRVEGGLKAFAAQSPSRGGP